MNRILDKMFMVLNFITKDKYQHDCIGGLLALIVFCVVYPLLSSYFGHNLSFWIAYALSFVITNALSIFKELCRDASPDWVDVVFAFIGGSKVWIALAMAYAIAN